MATSWHPHPTMSQGEQGGLGCFAKFCIFVLIVVVLGVGSVVGGWYYLIHKYTADHADKIEVKQATDAEYQKVIEKAAFFAIAVSNNSPARLELSADDINTAIAMNPNLADAKGRCHFEIKNSELYTKASIPLDKIPGGSGRYLNGTFGLKIFISHGLLFASATSIEVNGSPINGKFMESFKNQNLAEKINQNPNISPILEKIQNLAVADDKLVIETKGWDPKMASTQPTSYPATNPSASTRNVNSSGGPQKIEILTEGNDVPPPASTTAPTQTSQPAAAPESGSSTTPLKPQQLPTGAPTNSTSNTPGIVIEGYDPPPE